MVVVVASSDVCFVRERENIKKYVESELFIYVV